MVVLIFLLHFTSNGCCKLLAIALVQADPTLFLFQPQPGMPQVIQTSEREGNEGLSSKIQSPLTLTNRVENWEIEDIDLPWIR